MNKISSLSCGGLQVSDTSSCVSKEGWYSAKDCDNDPTSVESSKKNKVAGISIILLAILH